MCCRYSSILSNAWSPNEWSRHLKYVGIGKIVWSHLGFLAGSVGVISNPVRFRDDSSWSVCMSSWFELHCSALIRPEFSFRMSSSVLDVLDIVCRSEGAGKFLDTPCGTFSLYRKIFQSHHRHQSCWDRNYLQKNRRLKSHSQVLCRQKYHNWKGHCRAIVDSISEFYWISTFSPTDFFDSLLRFSLKSSNSRAIFWYWL